MTCTRTDCQAVAVAMPTILVWASTARDHAPARLEIGLPVCAEHRASSKFEDLADEGGKAWMEHKFALMGVAGPCWETAQIEWRTIQ